MAHICEVAAEYISHQRHHICLRGALEGCVGVYDYG
jgi:hypothetical protein